MCTDYLKNKIDCILHEYNHTLIKIEDKKVTFKCGKCGSIVCTRYDSIKPNCKTCCTHGTSNKSISEFVDILKKHNHTFLKLVKRISGGNSVEFKCGNCSSISVRPYRRIDSKYCKYCHSESVRRTLDEYKEHFLKFGHTVLDVFSVNGIQKANFICGKCGGKSFTQYSNVKSGCKNCPNFISKSEKFLQELVKKEYIVYNVLDNNRSILEKCSVYGKDLELDIVLQDKISLKFICAIEWNGEYYHKYRKVNDNIKIKKMKNLKIPLIIVKDIGNFTTKKVNVIFKRIKKIINKIILNNDYSNGKILYKLDVRKLSC